MNLATQLQLDAVRSRRPAALFAGRYTHGRAPSEAFAAPAELSCQRQAVGSALARAKPPPWTCVVRDQHHHLQLPRAGPDHINGTEKKKNDLLHDSAHPMQGPWCYTVLPINNTTFNPSFPLKLLPHSREGLAQKVQPTPQRLGGSARLLLTKADAPDAVQWRRLHQQRVPCA